MKVTTTYLEMTSRSQLRAKTHQDPHFRVIQKSVKRGELNRFLYILVGEPWQWRDKLSWDQAAWKKYAEDEALLTFIAYYKTSTAGYFELISRDSGVEIAYFGLAPEFIGRGLGGSLLTCALKAAWDLNPERVWVHTCSLDHPAALNNYLARGMVAYKTEETEFDPS